MGIRAKLFVPMLLLIVAMSLLIHFYWLPNYLSIERKAQIDQERQNIKLLGTAIIPALLANDLAEVHSTLDNVMLGRNYWNELTLYNDRNVRLYPLASPGQASVQALETFEYVLQHEQRAIGRLELRVDIDALMAREAREIRFLEQALLLLILLFSAGATLLQDRWIRKPLQRLIAFSDSLGQGRYEAEINHRSADELGKLVHSLDAMRDEIKSREEEITRAYASLASANARLEQISHTDALTGLANRRLFDEVLSREISRCTRQDTPLALLLCDIDYFKNYNDTYGHQQGDDCLRQIASAIKDRFMRAEDLVARYGGEEFGVILPNIGERAALALAEQMKMAIEALAIPHATSAAADHVTVSAGLTVLHPGMDMTMSTLIERADRALYQAKEEARNTVRAAYK